MAYSWNSEYLSHRHPDVLLRHHLMSVSEATYHFVAEAGAKEPLPSIARLVGLGHDFGKYTTFFQLHLNGGKVKPGLEYHSAASALFTAWLVEQENLGDQHSYLAPLAFTCVLRHHGNLQNPSTAARDFCKVMGRLKIQMKSIAANVERIDAELTELGVDNLHDFLDSYTNVASHIQRQTRCMERRRRREIAEGWRTYLHTLLLFSALIDADKRDAARIPREQREPLPTSLVERYRHYRFSSAPRTTMNRLRNQIYKEVLRRLDNLIRRGQPPRIITLTAPTGSGKTLTGLAAALKLRECLLSKGYSPPRIIYCLPYINIIEQTHQTFLEAIKISSLASSSHPLRILLKHHHLAFPAPSGKGEESLHHQLLLQESWDSELVVTTFVQLLHTLIGYRNSFLKKFHNISGSILILDEVQAIPIEYWPLARQLFTYLTKELDTHVIFMTATQPLIFPSGVATELIPNNETYFRRLNRTLLYYTPEVASTPQEAALFALERMEEQNAKSLLIVVNTIATSIQLYNTMKSLLSAHYRPIPLGTPKDTQFLGKAEDPILGYLSTNIVPAERMRRIKMLKRALSLGGRPIVVVSTQVVEAGVDLDFDMVVRDIGPIDSINQVAGRCNRSSAKKQGIIYIIRLVDDDGRPYAHKVYQRRHIEIAHRILSSQHQPIPESRFPDIHRRYMQEVKEYEGEMPLASQSVLDWIRTLCFENLDQFKLIKDEPKVPVFVELNPRAIKAKDEFLAALESFRKAERSQLFEQRANLRRSLALLRSYIVEIREHDPRPDELLTPGVRNQIWYLPQERCSELYDPETGYRRKSTPIHALLW